MSIRKRMVRLGVVLTLMLSFVLVFCFSVKAENIEYKDPETGNRLIIWDNADLLTDSEEQRLAETMKPALKYGHIMFFSNPEENYHSDNVGSFAGTTYYSLFHNESGTMFIVDFVDRDLYIASAGKNYEVINTPKANTITDNVYKKFSNGDYYNGITLCMEQIITVLNGEKISEPMKYISNAILSLLIGMIVCAIIVTATMGIKKAKITDILQTVKVNLKSPKAATTKTKTTKTYISSGGGGGGGFSGGGGGGFSGGGGGFSGGGGGGFSGGGGGHKF